MNILDALVKMISDSLDETDDQRFERLLAKHYARLEKQFEADYHKAA